jgi:hypothetical protein
MKMTSDQAENLALQALVWLLSEDDLAGVFLGSSGLSPDDLKTRAGDPEMLAAVLDFLLSDDSWVTGFCTQANLANDTPMYARQALPGGQQINWT